jgi:hypothetical protein
LYYCSALLLRQHQPGPLSETKSGAKKENTSASQALYRLHVVDVAKTILPGPARTVFSLTSRELRPSTRHIQHQIGNTKGMKISQMRYTPLVPMAVLGARGGSLVVLRPFINYFIAYTV